MVPTAAPVLRSGAAEERRVAAPHDRIAMSIADAVTYRAMKIFANTVKGLTMVDMLLRPHVRVRLPEHLPATRAAATTQRIPRVLWQTNYAQAVTTQIHACFRFNRRISPSYDYRFHDDATCDRFVAETYPGPIWNAYRRLQIGAARADFWRILVLLKHGGVYLDIDANLTCDLDRLIQPCDDGLFIAMKTGEVTNYFLASAPNNPVLWDVCRRIVANIEAGELTSVYHMTGPTVLEAAVRALGAPITPYKRACVQGQFVNKRAQYRDKPTGIWNHEQKRRPILAPEPPTDRG
jgi:mannosyltransferase OCH1-like enzyme